MWKSAASLCICLSCWTSGCLKWFLVMPWLSMYKFKMLLVCTQLKKVLLLALQSNLCLKQVHESTATCGALGLGQLQSSTGSFVCLFWGKKKESLSQWSFCYLSWRAQETLTKYLGPLCLKYLSIALDTMSTNASSVCYSSPFPLHPSKIFSGFYKGYYFLSRHLGEQIWLVLLYWRVSSTDKSLKYLRQFGT